LVKYRFTFIFQYITRMHRKIPRDGCATIPKNLDFVIGAVTKNARLSEADSKAGRRISLRITPPAPVRRPQD
jgi:hypothetical protein